MEKTHTNCNCNHRFEYNTCDFLDNLVDRVTESYHDNCGVNHVEGVDLPSQNEVFTIIHDYLEVIFPGYSGDRAHDVTSIRYTVGELLARIYKNLSRQTIRSLRYTCKQKDCPNCDIVAQTEKSVRHVLETIPEIRETLKLDIQAAFDGDPAAGSHDEIILSYPGLRAISIQRFAHLLYHEKIPLLPRMMTEYAHSLTGIDIHPGAHLGRGIFIDHGTGVVIGETCKLGDNVKLYQGVTLGAMSFPRDACGKIIKGAKRHPTIEDDVTIYSGATVLGNVVIGKGSIIGGNVWLTEDVAPGSKITIQPPELSIRAGKPQSR